MAFSQRLALAVLVVLVDSIAFALPLTALGLAYVVLARPPWVLEWVVRLYRSDEGGE
jgi:hypothetical protein